MALTVSLGVTFFLILVLLSANIQSTVVSGPNWTNLVPKIKLTFSLRIV